MWFIVDVYNDNEEIDKAAVHLLTVAITVNNNDQINNTGNKIAQSMPSAFHYFFLATYQL